MKRKQLTSSSSYFITVVFVKFVEVDINFKISTSSNAYFLTLLEAYTNVLISKGLYAELPSSLETFKAYPTLSIFSSIVSVGE